MSLSFLSAILFADKKVEGIWYASSRLWNQITDSFRQPRHSCLDSPPHSLVSSSLSSSPLSSSITPSLFHSRLKTCLFNKSSHLLPWTAFTVAGPDQTYYACRFFSSFFFFKSSVCSVWWTKLATRQLFTAC